MGSYEIVSVDFADDDCRTLYVLYNPAGVAVLAAPWPQPLEQLAERLEQRLHGELDAELDDLEEVLIR
jgi:hypothetical protein